MEGAPFERSGGRKLNITDTRTTPVHSSSPMLRPIDMFARPLVVAAADL